MNDGRKWIHTACIFLAGMATLCSSLFGCVGILGVLWEKYSEKHLFPHALLLLEVPLFALAMTVSRRFILGLWAIALVYPSVLLMEGQQTNRSALMVFPGVGTIATLMAAALLQYCVHPIAVPGSPESQGARYAPKS
jgi:hypothetical protein